MGKTIAFMINKGLGINLALYAIKHKSSSKNKILVFCKDTARKYFRNTKAKLVRKESDIFASNPDLVFSINYWRKINKKHVRNHKIINLHHSYNLTYRGRHTCTWAIVNARRNHNWTHGTTLHLIDDKIDSGQIVCSYSCPIFEWDTAYSLFLRVEKLARKMFKRYYPRILRGDYETKSPSPVNFYYRRRNLNHNINLNQPAIDIYDRIRALTFPGKPLPFTVIKGNIIKFKWGGIKK